jgi:uncharacterized membrane protein
MREEVIETSSLNLSEEVFLFITKRKFMQDKHHRSIAKAFSWRILGTIDTVIISYLVTGNIKLAASIGIIETFTKMTLYYFHERIWDKINFGRLTNIDGQNLLGKNYE